MKLPKTPDFLELDKKTMEDFRSVSGDLSEAAPRSVLLIAQGQLAMHLARAYVDTLLDDAGKKVKSDNYGR